MGNRALVHFCDKEKIYPGIYLHWGGSYVAEYLVATEKRMKGREGDASYATARFCGIAHTKTEGNLSLGIIDAPPGETREEQLDALRHPDYSHGDAGVFLVYVGQSLEWLVETVGGYGFGPGLNEEGAWGMRIVRSAARRSRNERKARQNPAKLQAMAR